MYSAEQRSARDLSCWAERLAHEFSNGPLHVDPFACCACTEFRCFGKKKLNRVRGTTDRFRRVKPSLCSLLAAVQPLPKPMFRKLRWTDNDPHQHQHHHHCLAARSLIPQPCSSTSTVDGTIVAAAMISHHESLGLACAKGFNRRVSLG